MSSKYPLPARTQAVDGDAARQQRFK